MKSGTGNMDLVKRPESSSYFSELLTSTTASSRRALSAVFQYPVHSTGEDTVGVNVNPSKLGDNSNVYGMGQGTELTSLSSPSGMYRSPVSSSSSSKLTVSLGPGLYSEEKAETI